MYSTAEIVKLPTSVGNRPINNGARKITPFITVLVKPFRKL